MTRAIWMITLTWFGVVGGAPAARSEPIDCATAQECYAEGERYAKRSGRRPAVAILVGTASKPFPGEHRSGRHGTHLCRQFVV